THCRVSSYPSVSCSLRMLRHPQTSTLFPYTTLFRSYKLNSQEDKYVILDYYLNTVYFGRGAYGVQAAAEAYFGKDAADLTFAERSEEHTSELQSRENLVCRLLLEKKNK